jgi:hypothetical protein
MAARESVLSLSLSLPKERTGYRHSKRTSNKSERRKNKQQAAQKTNRKIKG